MLSKWHWRFVQFSQQLWVRAVLYALLAVVTVLSTIVFKELIPADLAGKIGAEAVDKILGILASGMLVVTILIWIEHLSQLGHVGETSSKVEKVRNLSHQC